MAAAPIAPAATAGVNPASKRRMVFFFAIVASLASGAPRSHGVDDEPDMGEEVQGSEQCKNDAGDAPEPADNRDNGGVLPVGCGECKCGEGEEQRADADHC